MIQLLETPKNGIVKIKVNGNIDRHDYDKAIPLLEEQIKQHGKIKMYGEVEDFNSISAMAIWQDLKFDFKHFNDFSKIAVIADQKWVEWISKAGRYFTTAEVKHFHLNEKAQAIQWLQE